jgi:putative membrane protein
MMRWLIGIVVNAIIFIAIAGYFDQFYVASIGAALGASFLLSIINTFVRPILIIFTLPVTILSLGLFLIVINAFMLQFTDFLMGDAFEIHGFGMALLATIILTIANILIQKVVIEPFYEKR